MWIRDEAGRRLFACGKEDYERAAAAARECTAFARDDEDELVCDDAVSCYNCKYRRWSAESFYCMKA